MAQTRKTEYPIHQPEVVDRGEVVRKQIPSKKSGFDVVFEEVPSKVVSDQQLDPRIVTLEQCIRDNMFIDPKQVQEVLNLTDPNDLDSVAGKIAEDTFSWLKENISDWDFENNVRIVPDVDESK